MSSNIICIFDLPEPAEHIALHLPQSSLYNCVQVSKAWNAMFIPHLWRTFNDRGMRPTSSQISWSSGVSQNFLTPQYHLEDLKWYKEVYRRHAKYIRHLTFHQPATLDAFLEGAFGSSSQTISIDDSNLGTLTPVLALPITATTRSLLTNLESLTINVIRQSIATYFNRALPTGEQPATATFSFGYTGFGNNNNSNADNNNDGIGNEDTTDHMETTTPTSVIDPEKLFIETCQKLILCNPKLRTLKSPLSPRILEGLHSSPLNGQALLSLKNISVSSLDGLLPKFLPLSVSNLDLNTLPRSSNYNLNGPPGVVYEGLEVLNVGNVLSGSHLKALLIQAPSIKTLSLSCTIASPGFGGGGFGFEGDGYFAPTSPWPLSRVTVLKCHQLRGVFSMSKSFEGIFRAFPLLVEYHDDYWSPTVAPELIQHCPFLEVIRVEQENAVDQGFPIFYPAFSRRITPRHVGDPLNNSISELLSSLSRLRVMAIPYQMISGEHILENPWVCLDLEELSCQIVGLPFLTKEQKEIVQEIHHRENQIDDPILPGDRTHEESQLMNLSKRCISTRKAIMTQLSKLTSLKHLSLSPDLKNQNELFENRLGASLVYKSDQDGKSYIRYNDVLPDTPHLRLDSGLEELASLTQLEYLGFESMDHQMDTAEIEWVAKHFPRLKEMRGLATENYIGIEPDVKNDTLVALIRKLRPDVVQGQSFERYTPRPAFGVFGGGFGPPSTGSLFS